MGLHRTETFQRNIKDEKDKMAAGVTFWVVYILERRSSIGLGVPFIMQDLEIDPSLPRPVSCPISYEFICPLFSDVAIF